MNKIHEKIGALLKLERERRKIPLEEISTELRISAASLESIEAGDASTLPSEVYFRLFAKAYAEALGIDYTRTVEAIKDELAETMEQPLPELSDAMGSDARQDALGREGIQPTTEPARPKTERPLPLRTIGIVIAVVVLAGIIFLIARSFIGRGEKNSAAGESAAAGIIEGEKNRQTGGGQYGAYDWNVVEYKEPSGLALTMIAKGETWGTVLADGDTVLFQNLVPGQTYDFKAKYRLVVSVAAPSDVDLLLNGRPVDLVSPDTKRIVKVEINQMNLASFLSEAPVSELNGAAARKADSAGADTIAEHSNRPEKPATGGADKGNGDPQ